MPPPHKKEEPPAAHLPVRGSAAAVADISLDAPGATCVGALLKKSRLRANITCMHL